MRSSANPVTVAASFPSPDSDRMRQAPALPPPRAFSGSSTTRIDSAMDGSSRSSSGIASFRTLNFLRTIIGRRNEDYCAETPTAPHGHPPLPRHLGAAHAGLSAEISSRGLSGARGGSVSDDMPGPPSLCRRLAASFSLALGSCCPATETRRRWIMGLLGSPWYKAFLILLTFILLFGAQIRFIFVPAAGDTACDVVFMLVFCVFWVDIFMRVDVEPNYFHLSLCGLTWSRSHPRGQQQAAVASSAGGWCTAFEVGSFLFWCDVLSTLALLQDISFINPDYFSEYIVSITLDSFGIPQSGLDTVNAASPVKPELGLLVTIAKSLRCARFIRSSTAIKISSRVDWNALLNILDPGWWCAKASRQLAKRNEPAPSGSQDMEFGSGRSASIKPGASAGGGGLGNGGEAAQPGRRISWGEMGLSALAAIRAERLRQNPDDPSARNRKGALDIRKRALRALGLQRFDRDEVMRHVAATKIQRAWRQSHYQQDVFQSHSSLGIGWRERQNHARRTADNPVETELQKRSFVRKYSSMNRNKLGPRHKSRIPLAGSVVGSNSAPSGGPEANKRKESQVGTAMRELTGQRVAIGIIVALVLTVLFTYTEEDATRPSAMIVLHNQTGNPLFANRSLDAARASSIPDLYYYQLANGQTRTFEVTEVGGYPASTLRPREIYSVTVRVSGANTTTVGSFAFRNERVEQAWVSVFSTIFIILVWFFGVTAFAGPVMVLVVIPIERMVRLLAMIMSDPLGYESTLGYKIFMDEEESITKNTRWTKEVLKGMETSFLMSTILRIGSLMKVGFGSAGVEIIRNNLEKGQSKNMLVLSSQGSSVACIFLFCDIRQFTDATECLQEEVFVFTNRIAAVVHSICHSYGGSANKNIGDAFLLSWLLEEEPNTSAAAMNGLRSSVNEEAFVAKYNQADKALLSVVKICMALHYDDFYVRGMSDGAREALMTKLAKRKGPVVQMGFGLHAGKAVQGAIGSQRKIDATYVSEHVERAEFLESSTKKYGVKMLMSDSFHRLLHPGNRRRCRKIDQILIQDEDDAEDDYLSGDGKIIELLTFDMDIDALWKSKGSDKKVGGRGDATPETDSAELGSDKGAKREAGSSRLSQGMLRRLSVARQSLKDGGSDEFVSEAFALPPVTGLPHEKKDGDGPPAELVLPTGPALYNANVWVSEDMRRIRQKYSDGLFFQKFSSGLQAYYARDWEHARHCFVTVLDLFEDGPSRYFLNQIEKSNGVPPRDFKGYGVA